MTNNYESQSEATSCLKPLGKGQISPATRILMCKLSVCKSKHAVVFCNF